MSINVSLIANNNEPELSVSDCCDSSGCVSSQPQKYRCPGNGVAYAEVSARTILHHVKSAWAWQPTAQRYFFCEDPACQVVYFGDDDSTITLSELRTPIGQKNTSYEAMLCYCFGVTKEDYSARPSTRDFVVSQTKNGQCSCDTSNPSGRCCLRNFPKSS